MEWPQASIRGTMFRRSWLQALAVASAACLPLAAAACGAGSRPRGQPGGYQLALRPAAQLALALADLPPGFEVVEEMNPPAATSPQTNNPWGRVSAYSVTYQARPHPPAGQPVTAEPTPLSPGGHETPFESVASSVNAYAAVVQAIAAFASWTAALPPTYRRLEAPSAGLGDESIVVCRVDRPQCLVGFRSHNILASIWVSNYPDLTTAPVEPATTFARMVAARIAAVVGR